jgi:hypothetical protein
MALSPAWDSNCYWCNPLEVALPYGAAGDSIRIEVCLYDEAHCSLSVNWSTIRRAIFRYPVETWSASNSSGYTPGQWR